ncbi:hypothetical protein MCOR27_006912 [Pyricularia oryzae]|uniref:Uncharacterized protein n=3 Tax=Pyricularia TaxID=48558 RepID=A0ABQ8NCD7_PYRGI|nr:uncharacterized protein MGG_04096 [Pyricularia oryzae 70-15]KAH8845875.1 hypothetical protein MCOR01_003098 [Pyricularia oryzae]KAI6294796.1 hypothetical protein MCOR33_008191 [Pyricularia grisea]EHA47374.1 hypothetical protein MGG_04096 [Pyricularia oryzae 70-15]KAI6257100.1 hypothetical protein MCOR19_006483 [Pyricularia oryzae]KAI6268968.1 hypothetical protein MCOR26_008929 [Pyricularia oryzae]
MSSSEASKKTYWIPNIDIHRKVIVAEIRYYLGPEASVRTYQNEGEDGFLITTPGPCLSDEQIDDICNKSREMYKKQAEARQSSGSGGSSSADAEQKTLKRPWHKPVVISRGGSNARNPQRRHRRDDERGGRSRRPG